MTDRAIYTSKTDTAELLALSAMPEPLRLAEMLERTMQTPLHGKAAGALRRLHEVNAQLLEALEEAAKAFEIASDSGGVNFYEYMMETRAAIAAAKTSLNL